MPARATIEKALALRGFDAMAARAAMGPRPRPTVRPSEQPGHPRTGAVLIVLYLRQEVLHTLLIQRQEHLTYHPGQISFPGGRRENGESFRDTALRETFEEVGIAPAALTVLGKLEPLYILPSDFCIHPFAAWHEGRPSCRPAPAEVAGIFEVPVESLYAPSARGEEIRHTADGGITVPYYLVRGHKVWGATAMILSEVIGRLHEAEA